jgi:hypothetical protein
VPRTAPRNLERRPEFRTHPWEPVCALVPAPGREPILEPALEPALESIRDPILDPILDPTREPTREPLLETFLDPTFEPVREIVCGVAFRVPVWALAEVFL